MSEPVSESENPHDDDQDPFDDEFDSPFAHVPAADAGPMPFQDGYWTYEKMISATGRTTARNRNAVQRAVMLTIVVLILAFTAFGLLSWLFR